MWSYGRIHLDLWKLVGICERRGELFALDMGIQAPDVIGDRMIYDHFEK
jgi:hypothetical protein